MTTVLLFIFLLFPSAPPVKQEVEMSSRRRDLPDTSLALLNTTLRRASDVRYFRETDGNSRSYEVKFRLDGARWSVEFSADGELEDVEIERSLSDLQQATVAAIRSSLNQRFSRYNIRKVQAQYLSWPPDLGSPTAYELIVEGSNPNEIGLFEVNFDPFGAIQSERRVLEIPDL